MATSASGEWHAFGAYPDPRPVDLSKANQLCFWIYDTTANNDGKADNTVGVKLFDAAGANEEVWTDNELAGKNPKTVQNEWTQMCLNLDAYTTVDLAQIDKIQFALFWAGTYYVDDIQMVSGGAVATEPVVAQDFEKADTFYSDYQADVSLATDIFHGGKSSLMATSASGEWHAFGAYPDPRPIDMSAMKQMCFWIYDTTANNDGKADNTVGVKLFDAAGTNEEVWTDNELAGKNPKTVQNEWTQMCLNLDAYTTVDLAQIDKIQFALFWAGTYYVDDITLIPGGGQKAAEPEVKVRRVADTVQDFEKAGSFYSDYQADVSLATDIFHGGKSSLMASSTSGEWHSFGAYPAESPLDLTGYDQLSFWIYDTTANNNGLADNSVGVKLFDAAGTEEEIWTDNADAGKNIKTKQNEWVKMTLNLAAFKTVKLSEITKIQFSMYWAGNYYVDDIKALKPVELSSASAVLQDFEKPSTFYADYQADVSLATDIFHGGKSSLLGASKEGEWHSFGAIPATKPVDISTYGKLCFWIYDTTANNSGKADNSVGVKLFDTAGVSEEIWTDNAAVGKNPKTVQNEWTQMCLDLGAFENVDLRKIEKVQFALYWAGNYYIDDIEVQP